MSGLTDDERRLLWTAHTHPGLHFYRIVAVVEKIKRYAEEATAEKIAQEFDRLHESDEPDPWYWSEAADIAREQVPDE